MKPLRLQTRLLLLVLVPISLLAFTLGLSTVSMRYHDLDTVQDQRARLLLAKYQFAFDGMRNVTLDGLQNLALGALEETGVRSLSVLNEQGKVLLHSGPQRRLLLDNQTLRLDKQSRRYTTKDSWVYVQQLDNPIIDQQNHLQQAWVVLEFGTADITLQKYEALLVVSLLCFVVLLLVSIFLAQRVHKWLTPASQMADIIKHIDSEHLDRRLYTEATGDLRDLETEINLLLERLATDTEDLQLSMTQANEDLRETMEAMEVQNIELALARKEAIEGNRIKSEFLANISHEIRTPLNGIMGFAKLLLKTQMSPRQIDYVKTILKSSDSLLALINDVLDLSKIEAGKLALDHAVVDIEEVIFDVLGMLAPLADEKNLEQVAFIYDDVPRHLMGDPLRLKQIITNLVSNAIKFTPEGEITLRCMLESQTERYVTLRITVTDTGIGLSDSARRDLFQAFSQGDPSTTRKFGGTGLGLVISRHLVEQMHGEINFESHGDKGTTFWFTIRAELDQSLHLENYDELEGKHIFVAEPHSASRQFLTNTLEHWGIETQSAESLEELYSSLKKSAAPAALIINLSLLGNRRQMSDFQLAELRRLMSGPIIIITRNGDNTQEIKLNTPNASFMARPIVPRELYQRLVKVLSAPVSNTMPSHLLTASPNTTLRVLAVDDNPANLKLVCTLLEDMNVAVSAATTGQQAVQLCKEQSFDLIFMDIQMPGISGLEATQLIRAHAQETNQKRIPIVALTAHAMANERDTLLKSGMDDYLTKPIQESQIVHTLIKWTGVDPQHPSAQPLASEQLTDSSPQSIMDWTESIRLAAGKTDLARDMLIMLFTSLEHERRKISNAYADDNMDNLLNHVHYLHGATRYCGVPRLRAAAQQAETAIKTQINQYQQQLSAGEMPGRPRTDSCEEVITQLLDRIDELVNWRENNNIPE